MGSWGGSAVGFALLTGGASDRGTAGGPRREAIILGAFSDLEAVYLMFYTPRQHVY